MRVTLDDLTLDFTYTGARGGRDQYTVIFYRNDTKLPGSLEGLSPGPFVKTDEAMAREAIGFATSCPHWEFGDRDEWESYQHEWYDLYQALGGEHSVYALLADEGGVC